MPTSQRQLAAIMFTDMEGYTSLAQQNESLALTVLEAHFSLFRSILPSYSGTEIKTTGDGLLISFPSAVEALRCAIQMLEALATHNAAVGIELRKQHRIGLHLGDILRKDGDIFGDSVNIASRVAGAAAGGEICISKQVYDDVANKADISFLDIGELPLKGLSRPLRVFKVTRSNALPTESTPSHGPDTHKHRSGSPPVVLGTALVILLGVFLIYRTSTSPPIEVSAPPQTTAKPTIPQSNTTDATNAEKGTIQQPKSDLPRVDHRHKKNWRKYVKVGMTGADIKRLFGEPDNISTSGSIQIWYYGSGTVKLDGGTVFGWSDPR